MLIFDLTKNFNIGFLVGMAFDGMKGDWIPYTKSEDNLSILSENGLLLEVGTGDSYKKAVVIEFKKAMTDIKAVGQQANLSIRKEYSATENPYVINVSIELSNQGNQDIEEIWFGVADQLDEDVGRFLEGMRPQFFTDGDIETYYDLEDISEEPEFVPETPTVWFGLSLFFRCCHSGQAQSFQRQHGCWL